MFRSGKCLLQTLGPEHPHTAETYNNIAAVHSAMGEHDTALTLNQQSLALHTKTLGDTHASTASAYAQVAATYAKLKNPEIALDMWNKCLAVRLKTFGPTEVRSMFFNPEFECQHSPIVLCI